MIKGQEKLHWRKNLPNTRWIEEDSMIVFSWIFGLKQVSKNLNMNFATDYDFKTQRDLKILWSFWIIWKELFSKIILS